MLLNGVQNKIRIGLDLHNLSTVHEKVIRTGIQQVVFYLLEAQHWLRVESHSSNVEIVPLPMLPWSEAPDTIFSDLQPAHVNNSSTVLQETAIELNIPPKILWSSEEFNEETLWTEDNYYSVVRDLDWLIITGLCEFRHVAEILRRINPKVRFAVLVYDLIPFLRPELTDGGVPWWFHQAYLPSIRHFADLIFTISRNTALDTLQIIENTIKSKIPIFATQLPDEIPELMDVNAPWNEWGQAGIKQKRYFVCLGTIEPRKNLILAIRGFVRYLDIYPEISRNFKLVIVGKKGWNREDEALTEEIQKHSNYFYFTGYLPKSKVEQILIHAKALLMPSRYEGYGMPLTLAREFGIPVITCVNSSLPEASRLNATFVPVDSVDSMALALGQSALIEKNLSVDNKLLDNLKVKTRQEWRNLLSDWIDMLVSYQHSSLPE